MKTMTSPSDLIERFVVGALGGFTWLAFRDWLRRRK
jgi:hypothetical protein